MRCTEVCRALEAQLPLGCSHLRCMRELSECGAAALLVGRDACAAVAAVRRRHGNTVNLLSLCLMHASKIRRGVWRARTTFVHDCKKELLSNCNRNLKSARSLHL